MPIVVTVYRQTPQSMLFEVEGYILPGVFEEFLDVALRNEIDTDRVFVVNVDDETVLINHDEGLPDGWYVRVIDAVKDCVADEHEVVSRSSNWP